MPQINVQALDVMAESYWSFGVDGPQWRHRRDGSMTSFDPFPGYRHDFDEVKRAVAHVDPLCPPLWEVDLMVADREETARSNGHSNVHQHGHYDDGDNWVRDAPVGLIVLSGKRIPPHPAMTRYLVAHEYGHHVDYMVNAVRHGIEHLHDDEALMREYVEVRGLPPATLHHGEGGTWHDSVREIFACDFRLIVCHVEPAFWPHPGVPYPEWGGDLERWWTDALASLAAARENPGSAAAAS
jgi:hypothetical protein